MVKVFLSTLLRVLTFIVVPVLEFMSCGSDSHGTNEFGDFHEILKLSVLSIDYNDVYVIERNIGSIDNPIRRKLVYTVKGRGEYKYDLEKVYCYKDSISGKNTIILPQCTFVLAATEPPSLDFVEKDGSFINPQNVTFEDEAKYRSQLKDSIKSRLDNIVYKQEAFKHTKAMLKTFFKNLGDTTIVVKESDNL